jgi:hypothetical protein
LDAKPEIWRLHYALTSRPAASAALSGALGGAAGFGKTRLATEYLHSFGPLHYPGGIFWLNTEAGVLSDQGDVVGACQLMQEVVGIHRRLLGPQHPDTLSLMSNLASALLLSGNPAQALGLAQEVLEASRRIMGAEHPDTSYSAEILFMALHEVGDFDAAFSVLHQDLLWLVDRDPVTLGEKQRSLQGRIRKLTGYGPK